MLHTFRHQIWNKRRLRLPWKRLVAKDMDAKSWSMTLSKNQRLRPFPSLFHNLWWKLAMRLEQFFPETRDRIHHPLVWACLMCHWSRFLPRATSFVCSHPKIPGLWSALVKKLGGVEFQTQKALHLGSKLGKCWAYHPNPWILRWLTTSDETVVNSLSSCA